MSALNKADLLLAMLAALFILGTLSIVIGMIVLVSRTFGRDMRTITHQTSKLVSKGLTNEIAGLVGNASVLMNATSEMVKTTSGIGVVLIAIGLIQIGIAIAILYFLA